MYENLTEKLSPSSSRYHLNSILERYSHVRMATASDNTEILKFFSSIDMETPGLHLGYDRDPDFFAFTRMQGDLNQIALFLNDDRSIGGIANFSIATYLINGQPQLAAYLGDLRISPKISRAGRTQWRKFYTEILSLASMSPDFLFCKYQYSAILDHNISAIQALTKGKLELIYKPMFKYKTISIFGEIPFSKWTRKITHQKIRKLIQVTQASDQDQSAITDFLAQSSQNGGLSYAFPEELERRFKMWPHFSVNSFLLAKNKAGKIVGLCAPTDQSQTRKLVVQKISQRTKALGFCSRLMGRPSLKEGQPLNILYLTHLCFDPVLKSSQQNDILLAFIEKSSILYPTQNFHTVSFFQMEGQNFESSLNSAGYLFQQIPATLYQVYHPANYHPIHISNLSKVTFEIGTA